MAVCLKPGLHRGVVKSFQPPNNTIKVFVKDNGAELPCIWAAGIISGMLGFKTSYYPPLKTEVIVWVPAKSSFGYVIGTVPSITLDPGMQRRDMAGDGTADDFVGLNTFHKSNSTTNQMFAGHKPPVDLAEGELNIENFMGVGLSLLRHLSSLQAGDLARVECHLMDDMVRIISDTFKQYTAFGDYKISNDGGKLNVEWNGTSHDFEAWGNQTAQDPKAPTPSRTDVGNNLLDSAGKDDGRWRFTQYIGWLGNFIHTYITDPVEGIGKIAENQFRAGKAHLHVNDDGSVLLQSIADIVLEKVVAIPVPIRIRTEDDPEGDQSDGQPQNPFVLATWKPSDQANMFEMAFQLREYARWLNNTYSLARFYQQKRDFQVPTEAQTPAPDVNSGTADKQKQNPGITNWQLKYCTIRIYRDGSIQTVDAYGNVITTTAVGIQISTPKDLLLQAGGSVNIVAGRDINLLAQKNVNISAVTEAVRLSGRAAMLFICTAGNIVHEVATSFWHKIIGNSTFNNTVSITTDGSLQALATVSASELGAVLSVTAPAVFSSQTYQSSPNQEYDSSGDTEQNHTWTSATAPSVALSLPSITDHFSFQDDYSTGVLYQTLTQQQLAVGDVTQLPSASSLLGAAVGASSGIKAALAAAAAVVNARAPGAVDPVTGAINLAIKIPSITPGFSKPIGSAVADATQSVLAIAASAGTAASAATKLVQIPHLQKASDVVAAVQSKVESYISATTSAMTAGVTQAEIGKLIAQIQNPLGPGGVPSVGSLSSYLGDITIVSNIESTASAATAVLSSAIGNIQAELPGIPALPNVVVAGVTIPPIPAGPVIPGIPAIPAIPTMDSVLTGPLSTASGVVTGAAASASAKALTSYGLSLPI